MFRHFISNLLRKGVAGQTVSGSSWKGRLLPSKFQVPSLLVLFTSSHFFWLYCFFEFIQGLYFCCHFNPIFILNFSRICIYLLICNLVHSGFNYPWQQESTQGHFGNSFLYFTYIPCSTSGINMLCYVL